MRFAARTLAVAALIALATVGMGSTPADARMCVTHVRNLTGIMIPANAWGWWSGAEGRFERGNMPTPGSILVWRRAGNLPLGHVGVVARIVDSRTILVDHSWDSDALRRNQQIVDTSANNDWSSVSVWYHPLSVMGGEYATYGFVYPPGTEPSAEEQADFTAVAEAEREALLQARAHVVHTMGLDRPAAATGADSRPVSFARHSPHDAVAALRSRTVAARRAESGLDAEAVEGYAAAYQFPEASADWVDPDLLAARAAAIAVRTAPSGLAPAAGSSGGGTE